MNTRTWLIIVAVLIGCFVVVPALLWTIWLLRIAIMVVFLVIAAFYVGRLTKRK